MSIADLFRPKWKNSDPAIRIAAVAGVIDQSILAGIAKTDKDSGVRRTAVAQIGDDLAVARDFGRAERGCHRRERARKSRSSARMSLRSSGSLTRTFRRSLPSSRGEPVIAKLEKAYRGKVQVAWKNFPLAFHISAKPAAEAALAAHEQGKFWEMHDILFKNQQSLTASDLEKYAKEIGLDVAKFKSAVDSHKFAAQIEADIKEGSAIGVSGTPAAFVNGHLISGAQPIDAFRRIIDAELLRVGDKVRTKSY